MTYVACKSFESIVSKAFTVCPRCICHAGAFNVCQSNHPVCCNETRLESRGLAGTPQLHSTRPSSHLEWTRRRNPQNVKFIIFPKLFENFHRMSELQITHSISAATRDELRFTFGNSSRMRKLHFHLRPSLAESSRRLMHLLNM